jgi:hypothetical protein
VVMIAILVGTFISTVGDEWEVVVDGAKSTYVEE